MIKWDTAKLEKDVDTVIKKFLFSVGLIAVGQAQLLAPTVTARYKNGIHFMTDEAKSSGFGNFPGKDGKVVVDTKKTLGSPKDGYVRIGNNVKYASKLEKKYGIFKMTVYLIEADLEKLFADCARGIL